MTAFIFDLDGLLAETEQLHFEAYHKMLGDYGIELTREMFVNAWLSGKHYGTRYFLEKAGITDKAELDKARLKKADIFRNHASGKLSFRPGAEDFLKKMEGSGIRCGIGTGGYEPEYALIAEELGLYDYVETIVGGSDVKKNKPDPEIFLTVAKKLNAKPDECVVFENSDIGMNSGLNANMYCVVIPSEFTDQQDFSEAHEFKTHFDEVDIEALIARNQ
jgi:beta-phosphoglucomutase